MRDVTFRPWAGAMAKLEAIKCVFFLGGFVNSWSIICIWYQQFDTTPVLIKLNGKSHHGLQCLVCECQLHEYLPSLPRESSRNFQSFAFCCSQPHLGCWALCYCPMNSHQIFIYNNKITDNKKPVEYQIQYKIEYKYQQNNNNNLLRGNITGWLCKSKDVFESSKHLRTTSF